METFEYKFNDVGSVQYERLYYDLSLDDLYAKLKSLDPEVLNDTGVKVEIKMSQNSLRQYTGKYTLNLMSGNFASYPEVAKKHLEYVEEIVKEADNECV